MANIIKTIFILLACTAMTRQYTIDGSLNPNDSGLQGFMVALYSYTAVGWNYTEIDSSILQENLDYMKTAPGPYNSSMREYIYIFPEHTFVTTEVLNNRTLALHLAQRVPDPSATVSPCIINSSDPDDLVVTDLSCWARKEFSFVVVGILEKLPCAEEETCRDDGFKIYSTTAVFDRNGFIVAKYRKFHLIDEPALDAASTQEMVTFTTESNVEIALLTGYDLLFHEPAQVLVNRGIKHFISNGAWKCSMPFLFSTSVEMGFSEANNVFLATSNYMRGELGYTGRGKFNPGGRLISVSVAEGSGGLSKSVHNVDEPFKSNEQIVNQFHTKELIAESQDLRGWSSVAVPMSTETAKVEVCHGTTFCCTLTYSMWQIRNDAHYQLIAFDGNRTDGQEAVIYPEQTCGLAACSGPDVTTCGANKKDVLYTSDVNFRLLSLSGSFSSNKVIPLTMGGEKYYFPIGPLNLTTVKKDNRFRVTYEYEFNSYQAFHFFGLTSTDYKNSAISTNRPAIVLLLICLFSALQRQIL